MRANLTLVHHVLRRYRGLRRDQEDLFQVGCLGLLKAIDRFDADRGTQFSTYAVPLILGEVQRYLRDSSQTSAGRSAYRIARQAAAERARLAAVAGTEPTAAQVAENLGLHTSELIAAVEACREPLSLDEPGRGGEDTSPLLARLGATGVEVDHVALRALLRDLPLRQRQVLILRYYLDWSQADIASRLGISQPQISRIEHAAVLALRRHWRGEA